MKRTYLRTVALIAVFSIVSYALISLYSYRQDVWDYQNVREPHAVTHVLLEAHFEANKMYRLDGGKTISSTKDLSLLDEYLQDPKLLSKLGEEKWILELGTQHVDGYGSDLNVIQRDGLVYILSPGFDRIAQTDDDIAFILGSWTE